MSWLEQNCLKYKLVDTRTDKGDLIIFYNDNYCLKIYDRLGHGYSVTINVSRKYDESVYDNDLLSLHWVFDYFKFSQEATFHSRTVSQYQDNLPRVMTDLKSIIPKINAMDSFQWSNLIDWVRKKAIQRFS